MNSSIKLRLKKRKLTDLYILKIGYERDYFYKSILINTKITLLNN